MRAAFSSYHWALSGGSAEDCVGLARYALSGGEQIAADPGFLSIGGIRYWLLARLELLARA